MQRELLNVSGMTCGGCAAKVMRALQAVKGVQAVKVSVREGKAAVQFDEGVTTAGQLRTAVVAAGYGVNPAEALSSACKGCSCCS